MKLKSFVLKSEFTRNVCTLFFLEKSTEKVNTADMK